MAKEKKEEKLERTYNIPLRKEWLKVSRFRRANRAIKTIKKFLSRHMKVDLENIKLSKWVNQEIWKNGIKNPPHHIKVKAVKKENKLEVELAELPREALKEIEKEKMEKEKKIKEEKKPEEERKQEEEEKKEKEKKEKEKILKKEISKPKPEAMKPKQPKVIIRKALEK